MFCIPTKFLCLIMFSYLFSTKKLIHMFKTVYLQNYRSVNTEAIATDLFVNILGINGTDAQKYIQKHNIALLEHHRLKNTLNFMKQERFNVNEILKHPKIFKQCGHKPWEHYFTYFKECGCKEIPISNLLKKIRYSPIKLLKDRGILPTDTIVVQNLQDNLDIALDKTDIIRLNNDDHSLSYVHREVTHKYLEKRLGATQSDIEKISRIHYQIYNKSLKKLCENLNIALEIGYTKEKILRNPYILQVKPENTRELFEKLPQLINCDIQSELKRYPKLIGLSMDNVNAIYDILKKNEISDAAIKKNMNIFTLSPKTVLERIEDIKSTPDTRVLMANPRTLRLIIHYHRARDRLQFLHKFKLKCSCVLVIGFQDKIFDHYIKEGKDKNSSREVGDFLHALLKYDKADLEVNFRKHPYYLYVPFTEIEDTYLYLKQVQFEDCHIISAISILLYPKEKIINALNTIKEDHYLSTRKPRVNKRKILNLALYYLEKDHHFSGNGIWRVNDVYSPQ